MKTQYVRIRAQYLSEYCVNPQSTLQHLSNKWLMLSDARGIRLVHVTGSREIRNVLESHVEAI